jgi:hypothetical protein
MQPIAGDDKKRSISAVCGEFVAWVLGIRYGFSNYGETS